jgi:hypothetical protein
MPQSGQHLDYGEPQLRQESGFSTGAFAGGDGSNGDAALADWLAYLVAWLHGAFRLATPDGYVRAPGVGMSRASIVWRGMVVFFARCGFARFGAGRATHQSYPVVLNADFLQYRGSPALVTKSAVAESVDLRGGSIEVGAFLRACSGSVGTAGVLRLDLRICGSVFDAFPAPAAQFCGLGVTYANNCH